MKKLGAYKILTGKNLVIEYYSGEINLGDLFHFKNILSKEPTYNFFCNTVFDIRDAALMLSKSDLLEFNDFLSKKFTSSGTRNLAFLTSKPNGVVLSTLYSNLAEHGVLDYNIEIFSTIDGIVEWLNNRKIDCETIEIALSELKTTPDNVYA